MADVQYDNLQVVGYHEPDQSLELGPDGNKVNVPLPGMYTVGFLLGGKFMPLHSYKAGNIVDRDNKVAVNKGPQSSSSDTPQGEQQ